MLPSDSFTGVKSVISGNLTLLLTAIKQEMQVNGVHVDLSSGSNLVSHPHQTDKSAVCTPYYKLLKQMHGPWRGQIG